jgi:hypothetical protein
VNLFIGQDPAFRRSQPGIHLAALESQELAFLQRREYLLVLEIVRVEKHVFAEPVDLNKAVSTIR